MVIIYLRNTITILGDEIKVNFKLVPDKGNTHFSMEYVLKYISKMY